jgi:hypothetical protein
VTGTILAALFTGDLSSSAWSSREAASFQDGVTLAGLTLTAIAAALVIIGIVRSRPSRTTDA